MSETGPQNWEQQLQRDRSRSPLQRDERRDASPPLQFPNPALHQHHIGDNAHGELFGQGGEVEQAGDAVSDDPDILAILNDPALLTILNDPGLLAALNDLDVAPVIPREQARVDQLEHEGDRSRSPLERDERRDASPPLQPPSPALHQHHIVDNAGGEHFRQNDEVEQAGGATFDEARFLDLLNYLGIAPVRPRVQARVGQQADAGSDQQV